jgi:hypothetical protein
LVRGVLEQLVDDALSKRNELVVDVGQLGQLLAG